MKNRQMNYYLEINSSDIYCLLGNRTGSLLAGVRFNIGFETPPPPNVTVKYNNTLREKNFNSFGSSSAAVPARPFWIVVGFLLLPSALRDTG